MNYLKKCVLAGMMGIMLIASGCTREIKMDSFIKATEVETTIEDNVHEAETESVPSGGSLYLPEGEVADYTQLEDGTWEYKGQIYNYRHIISGIMEGNKIRSTIVILDKGSYCSPFEVYANKIIEEGTIDVYTGQAGYKIVECYHHDNALLNGRYISEQDDDTLFIELDYETVTFWDFGENYGEGNVEIDSSVSMPSYYDECKYMIVGNCIKILDDETKANIEIVDDSTLEYNGIRYVHEDSSSKEEIFVVSKTGYPQYDELIDLIVNIKDTNEYSAEVYRENGICYIFGMYDIFESSGFYLVDLNGDGVEELLLGENGNGSWRGTIYMIYTIKDGLLQMVCSGGERDTYTLCEGNYIEEEGSSGAASGLTAYYTFEDSKLKLKEAVVYDGFYDSENPLFLCTESLDVATGVHITSEEAAAIYDKYQNRLIEFTLFVRPEFR